MKHSSGSLRITCKVVCLCVGVATGVEFLRTVQHKLSKRPYNLRRHMPVLPLDGCFQTLTFTRLCCLHCFVMSSFITIFLSTIFLIFLCRFFAFTFNPPLCFPCHENQLPYSFPVFCLPYLSDTAGRRQEEYNR